MNHRMIARTTGLILRIETVLLLLPAAVSLLYGEHEMQYFLFAAALALAASLLLTWKKPRTNVIYAREGFIIVALSWVALSIFGALPFYLSGEIKGFVNCLFETVSGFTTTGASILTEIEPLSRGMLFWRSFTHWIGGMGVLVFAMAILPMDDGRPMHILRAEVPGPTVGKLVPKMHTTAKILYAVYLALTVLEIFILCMGGMDLYDSVVNSFATAGTGGFSVLNASIGGYHSPYAEWVISIFMLLFGINFNLFYLVLLGRLKSVFKSEELRWYLFIVAASTLAIAINISHLFQTVGETLRTAFFQVSSIVTTTGFATADYEMWPTFSKMIIVLLTIMGACAGSTGGGIKISRLIILLKSIVQGIRKLLHPRVVKNIKFEGRPVEAETQEELGTFFSAYIFLLLGSMLLVSANGFDMTTTATSVLTCVSNVGPGFSMVGPAGNFSAFSPLSKLVLCFDMLAGRLEIFPMLILLAPSTWKKK